MCAVSLSTVESKRVLSFNKRSFVQGGLLYENHWYHFSCGWYPGVSMLNFPGLAKPACIRTVYKCFCLQLDKRSKPDRPQIDFGPRSNLDTRAARRAARPKTCIETVNMFLAYGSRTDRPQIDSRSIRDRHQIDSRSTPDRHQISPKIESRSIPDRPDIDSRSTPGSTQGRPQGRPRSTLDRTQSCDEEF